MSKWIGVELDGTLAEFNKQYPEEIGEPLGYMVSLVKGWLKDHQTVKVLTPRASTSSGMSKVKAWLGDNDLNGVEVIASDPDMVTLWSSRAVRVEFNSGKLCRGCSDAPVQKHSLPLRAGGQLGSAMRFVDERVYLTDC
ncbi:hypothetical protein [Chitinimonas sp. BJB300]|uniref:hypothetical protein n=1 Tax=Chitinimonas sp. BJB300 TaxID=1559339 RepID=UPI001111DA88|nr:hypothetical protein [Chitinimonas sp. BJB300]TSJ91513.1 hypothetical protein FG002_004370 [Chitinimonas sp. BJB300]